jgi:hypothetical protein
VVWNLEKIKMMFSKKDNKLFTKILNQLNKNAKKSLSTPSIRASFYKEPNNLSNEVIVSNYDFLCAPENSIF